MSYESLFIFIPFLQILEMKRNLMEPKNHGWRQVRYVLPNFLKSLPPFLAWQKLFSALLWMNMRGRKMQVLCLRCSFILHEWSPILNDLNIYLPGELRIINILVKSKVSFRLEVNYVTFVKNFPLNDDLSITKIFEQHWCQF